MIWGFGMPLILFQTKTTHLRHGYIHVTYCTKQDKNHSLYSSTFPYIYIGVYLPKCYREDRGFEMVDFDFILNTMQVEPLGAYLIGYLPYGLPQRVSTG